MNISIKQRKQIIDMLKILIQDLGNNSPILDFKGYRDSMLLPSNEENVTPKTEFIKAPILNFSISWMPNRPKGKKK